MCFYIVEIAVLLNVENIMIDGESSSFDSFDEFPFITKQMSINLFTSFEELTACSIIVFLPVFTAFYNKKCISIIMLVIFDEISKTKCLYCTDRFNSTGWILL